MVKGKIEFATSVDTVATKTDINNLQDTVDDVDEYVEDVVVVDQPPSTYRFPPDRYSHVYPRISG